MANFLKIGNSQQNYETEKALGKATDFDLNAGEVVTVDLTANPAKSSFSTSTKITDPIGAIIISRSSLSNNAAVLRWEAGPNNLTVDSSVNLTSGSVTFLVF